MIKDNKQNPQTSGATQPAHASAPQFDAAQASEERSPLRGMGYINSIISRPMSRSGVGEQLTAFIDAMREVAKKELPAGDAEKYQFLPVDRVAYELPVNAIVVATLVRHSNGQSIMAYPILMEPTDGIPSRFLPIGQNEYEIPTTVSDAHDDRLLQAVASVLRNHFKGNADIDEVAFNFIPNDLLVTDEVRISRLTALVINTLAGAAKELPGNQEERFNVSMITGTKERPTGAQLYGRMDFNPAAKETVTGLPVRQDITVSTKLVVPAQNTGLSQGLTPNASILTQIGGYIDLMYIEPEMVQTSSFGQMVKGTNAYQARFVITGTDVETNGVTPELALLALASSYMLNNGNAWVNYFKKRHGVENDTRDIGAIGYEIPFGADGQLAKIDTGASDFNLHQFVARAFRPGLVFSIDVDQGGDDSWVWANLEYAANGDLAAIDDFIRTADNLTNNMFSTLWDRNQPIAQHSGNVLTLGYFQSGAVKEDLRKIDYVAMLNLFGAGDLNTVVEFANTFDPNQGGPDVRLGERTRKTRAVLQENVHFKKSAHRYDLNPVMLETLVLAIQKAGLNIIPESFFGDFNQAVRGSESMAAFAARPSQQPIFNAATRSNSGNQFASSMLRPSQGNRFQ